MLLDTFVMLLSWLYGIDHSLQLRSFESSSYLRFRFLLLLVLFMHPVIQFQSIPRQLNSEKLHSRG